MLRVLTLSMIAAALAGCAGDTRETLEPAFRRDGWDVQAVSVSVSPEDRLAWCSVGNDLFSLNLHGVPGRVVLPLRGRSAEVICRTHRGWIGTTTIERTTWGPWPHEVRVALAPDGRIAETREGRPSAVEARPFRAGRR